MVEKGSSLLGKDLIQILGINVLSCFATNTCTTTVAGKVPNSPDSTGNATSAVNSSRKKGVPSLHTKSTSTVPPKIKSEFPNLFSDKLGNSQIERSVITLSLHN